MRVRKMAAAAFLPINYYQMRAEVREGLHANPPLKYLAPFLLEDIMAGDVIH